jgi:Lar family restriction alleviation protein
MNNELKPCPFCGGEARLRPERLGIEKEWRVECECWNSCGAATSFLGKTEAIAAWNRRTPANEAEGSEG